jgi:hypothetical protein
MILLVLYVMHWTLIWYHSRSTIAAMAALAASASMDGWMTTVWDVSYKDRVKATLVKYAWETLTRITLFALSLYSIPHSHKLCLFDLDFLEVSL